MKKLIACLFILGLLFTPIKVKAESWNMLYDFEVAVGPDLWKTRTRLSFRWYTLEEMSMLKVEVLLSDGTKEIPFHWERGGGKDNSNCIWEYSLEPDENGQFHYLLEFDVVSGSYGTVNLKWSYMVGENRFDQPIFVTTGNVDMEEDDYSMFAAMVIGIVTLIGVSIATALLFRFSQQEIIVTDDEDENEIS